MSELIALSALFLASFQGWSTRQHQRLSVRPHLTIHHLYQRETPQIELTLRNEGIGPAIVEDYEVRLDGKKLDTSDKNCIVDLCKALDVGGMDGGGSVINVGEVLSVGYVLPLLRIKTSEEFDEQFDNKRAHKELERVQIQIRYKSLYRRKFTAALHGR